MNSTLIRCSMTIVTVALGAMVSMPARATAEYALQSGLTWYRIDNPFLYPSNDSSKLNTTGSAWSNDVRGALYLPLPTQRSYLQLTAAVSQIHYGGTFSNYSAEQSPGGPYNLSEDQKQLIAIYNWEFSDLLRGRLYHHTDDRLYNYFGGESLPSSTPANVNNVEPEFPHIREDSVEVAYRFNNHFDLPLTWTQQTLSYVNPGRVEMYNMNSDSVQAALRYTAGTKSTFSGGMRHTTVSFPNRTSTEIGLYDSGYVDTELFTDTAWRYSEYTVFLAHVGSIARRFNTLPSHNSQLVSMELGMDWHWSAKTTFYTRIWNRPQANEEADTRLYVITRGIQGRAVWQATPKNRVSLLLSLEKEESQNFTSTAVNGNDQVLRMGLRWDYDITRRLALRVEANRQQTTTNSGSSVNYNRSNVMVSLNYTFDNITGPFNFENQQGYNRARQQIEDLR